MPPLPAPVVERLLAVQLFSALVLSSHAHPAVHSFATNMQRKLHHRMSLTCYNSSDPAAVNATVLYDFRHDKENLWDRRSLNVSLPSCSSSSPPPDSHCLVCLVDQVVYAVCSNLTDGVKMMMEAGADQVQISKSDCPKPPSDDAPTGQLDGVHIFLIVFAVVFILVFIIIGVACAWKRWKRRSNLQSDQRAETPAQGLMPNGGVDIINADELNVS